MQDSFAIQLQPIPNLFIIHYRLGFKRVDKFTWINRHEKVHLQIFVLMALFVIVHNLKLPLLLHFLHLITTRYLFQSLPCPHCVNFEKWLKFLFWYYWKDFLVLEAFLSASLNPHSIFTLNLFHLEDFPLMDLQCSKLYRTLSPTCPKVIPLKKHTLNWYKWVSYS